ncbi:MAG TPA: hypothetical protein VES88_08470 [Gemmatimonadaceae bacterium]|nr:hypothetical protein [Gemmatimonadaceae bacterium]
MKARAKSSVLPIGPSYDPMEARTVDEIPDGEGWQYEPNDRGGSR